MKLEPTRFCYACGLMLVIESQLFCNDKCQRAYDRTKKREEKRQTRHGKKEGYGLQGSTH